MPRVGPRATEADAALVGPADHRAKQLPKIIASDTAIGARAAQWAPRAGADPGRRMSRSRSGAIVRL